MLVWSPFEFLTIIIFMVRGTALPDWVNEIGAKRNRATYEKLISPTPFKTKGYVKTDRKVSKVETIPVRKSKQNTVRCDA